MPDEVQGTARGQVTARILDLSVGGAQLHLQASLPVGAIHDFALDLDDGHTFWVQGEVRRCEPYPPSGYTVGIAFLGIDPHDDRRLRDWLARRQA